MKSWRKVCAVPSPDLSVCPSVQLTVTTADLAEFNYVLSALAISDDLSQTLTGTELCVSGNMWSISY